MITSFHHGSAKIYQFPARARPAVGVRHEQTVIDIHSPRVTATTCGSGWYHEAAIEADSKPTGEH